jgi:hypothetical protein
MSDATTSSAQTCDLIPPLHLKKGTGYVHVFRHAGRSAEI